ncbi:MAG: type II secretion system F family protein [Sedimentibacter sp.]
MTLYISLAFALFIFNTIIILFYSYGINYDKVNGRLSRLTNNEKEIVLDDDLNKSLSERFISPMTESIIKSLGKFIPENGSDNKKSESLRKQLRQAGISLMPKEYKAINVIIIIGSSALFFIIALLLNMNSFSVIIAPLFGAYAAFTIMRFSLMSRISMRKEKMERQLPDVLDMLSVNVEAGLGFEQAILHIIQHFQGPLIDELNITYREMSMGRSRRDALKLLGERCDVDDLKSFTGSINQASKLGISVKNILHAQASAIRESRRSKVEEKAHKMSIKILIPMVLFIFPVIFIVLMGPAVVSIIEMFGGM